MRILLAEDSAPTRRMLEAALQRDGHEVTSVGDGQAAWTAFEQLRPALVVLDWQMPELDGLEVCRRIRASATGPDAFVLMVTGRDAPGDLTSALGAGVNDYVMKPFSVEQLRARLVIATHRIEENIARRHMEQALLRSQWLAGIGQTTIALQHEINNPLQSLTVAAALLDDETSVTEQRKQSRIIADEARRIAAVVKRLATLKDPQTVEYLPGSLMLDLARRSEPNSGR